MQKCVWRVFTCSLLGIQSRVPPISDPKFHYAGSRPTPKGREVQFGVRNFTPDLQHGPDSYVVKHEERRFEKGHLLKIGEEFRFGDSVFCGIHEDQISATEQRLVTLQGSRVAQVIRVLH